MPIIVPIKTEWISKVSYVNKIQLQRKIMLIFFRKSEWLITYYKWDHIISEIKKKTVVHSHMCNLLNYEYILTNVHVSTEHEEKQKK